MRLRPGGGAEPGAKPEIPESDPFTWVPLAVKCEESRLEDDVAPGMCRGDLSAGSLTSRLPGGSRPEFTGRTLVVSDAGADAGAGGGPGAPNGDPRKPIGGKEEENSSEVKGEILPGMRRHLLRDECSC